MSEEPLALCVLRADAEKAATALGLLAALVRDLIEDVVPVTEADMVQHDWLQDQNDVAKILLPVYDASDRLFREYAGWQSVRHTRSCMDLAVRDARERRERTRPSTPGDLWK